MSELPEVINWRRLNTSTTLSGQPTEDQLAHIRDLGVKHIINLAPHSDTGALDDEKDTVVSLGMAYVHIPVDFDNPTESDFAQFCIAIEGTEHSKIHVHCIYNARVSAFFYRYAQEKHLGSESQAFQLMDGIWRPGGVWAKFIGNADSIDQPHLYAGRDY